MAKEKEDLGKNQDSNFDRDESEEFSDFEDDDLDSASNALGEAEAGLSTMEQAIQNLGELIDYQAPLDELISMLSLDNGDQQNPEDSFYDALGALTDWRHERSQLKNMISNLTSSLYPDLEEASAAQKCIKLLIDFQDVSTQQ